MIHELRIGKFSGGSPPAGFVLLLQEAYRGGPGVPVTVPPDAPVPDRIEATPPTGRRDDVAEVADREGLALLYLPSVRNGRESQERSEDRGNAILSTFDLSDPMAVELPLGRHRRVAVAATVSGHDIADRPWSVRVVSLHLDASTGPRRLWLFTSAQRERQARHVVDVLDNDAIATIVGADLNTWAGGTREPAFKELNRAFRQTQIGARFRWWFTLDYTFFGLPSYWTANFKASDSTFGSDHRPVVSIVHTGA
jgi:endonuclease/exonuclease/phosphatase family metal-dependent hydrolase